MKVVILASDPGKKLWPLAQKNIPKAYLPLYSNMSYLLETIFRISGLIRQGNDIIIILPKDSVELLDPSILGFSTASATLRLKLLILTAFFKAL